MVYKKRKIYEIVIDIFFYMLPTLVGLLLVTVLGLLKITVNRDVAIAMLSSAIVGFGFTATAMLIALPRDNNNYLRKLDEKGRLQEFAFFICTPSITALISLLFYALSWTRWAENLFIICVVQTFFSVFVLFRIIKLGKVN